MAVHVMCDSDLFQAGHADAGEARPRGALEAEPNQVRVATSIGRETRTTCVCVADDLSIVHAGPGEAPTWRWLRTFSATLMIPSTLPRVRALMATDRSCACGAERILTHS